MRQLLRFQVGLLVAAVALVAGCGKKSESDGGWGGGGSRQSGLWVRLSGIIHGIGPDLFDKTPDKSWPRVDSWRPITNWPVSIQGTYVIAAVYHRGVLQQDLVSTVPPYLIINITADQFRVGMYFGDDLWDSPRMAPSFEPEFRADMYMDAYDNPLNYTINTTQVPYQIDFVMRSVSGKVFDKYYGIFKVEGNQLTLCIAESGSATDRPREFKSTKDNRANLIVLKKKR